MITITSSTATPVNFNQFRVKGDSATFLGEHASDLQRDQLTVKSAAPKSGNGFHGNRRSDVSLVRSGMVPDLSGTEIIRDRKIAINFSTPVGTPIATTIEDAFQMGTLLQNADFVTKLAQTGIIEY